MTNISGLQTQILAPSSANYHSNETSETPGGHLEGTPTRIVSGNPVPLGLLLIQRTGTVLCCSKETRCLKVYVSCDMSFPSTSLFF